jgi:hypothetical protein
MEHPMSNDQQTQDQQTPDQQTRDTPGQDRQKQDPEAAKQEAAQALDEVDGLADKKADELTPEELRLMADTMPGEGPGD